MGMASRVEGRSAPARLAQIPKKVEDARAHVVILDGEGSLGARAARILSLRGYDCEVRTTRRDTETAIGEHAASVVLCNACDPQFDGLDFVFLLRSDYPNVGVLLVGLDPAIRDQQPASADPRIIHLPSPFDESELAASVARLAEAADHQRESEQLLRETQFVKRFADRALADVGLVAVSPQSAIVVFFVHRVAPTRATVLLEGETGTGKELIARLLHCWSHRSSGPFVALNCKAISDGTLESELFGHERGSFTGAIAEHAGCFERASGGTLFLDEIGETAPDFQAKLLRVLETGELMRVGGSSPRKVDVRVVAATNRTLRQEVAAGRFREDLFFRLNVINLRLPPLRERPEDILPLARHFLSIFEAEKKGSTIRFTAEAERHLLSYSWPGNVRELQNTIHRAVVLDADDVLNGSDFELQSISPDFGGDCSLEGTLHEFTERAKAQRIRAALQKTNGNHSQAAEDLGINRATLYRLIQHLGI
jgi:DNA-binding NtrC family response regulator